MRTETAGISDSSIRSILSADEPMLMFMPETVEPAPLKTSVTTLTRNARPLSDEDSEETVADKRKTGEAPRTFRLSSVPSRPAFLEEEKAEAVNIGTATHRFLRLIDLELFRREGTDTDEAVRREAERMKAEKILTEEDPARRRSYIALLTIVRSMMERAIELLGFSAPEHM